MRKKIVAIACSDLHLTWKPPVARSEEPDWLAAQARGLLEIGKLAEKHECPILCAGDVFDRWNAPVSLVNWALSNIPRGMDFVAIPGQHDLPNHRMEDIERSAYWTLAKTEHLIHLGDVTWNSFTTKDIYVQGFGWGQKLEPCTDTGTRLKIALVHEYIWIDTYTSYPGAPDENRLDCSGGGKKYRGWDVVVYGDNHKGFLSERNCTKVLNCGTFMRRKTDEVNYKPCVGLIYNTGLVERHFLDCSQDVIKRGAVEPDAGENLELKDFLESLTELGNSELDFHDTMKQALEGPDVSNRVKQLILEAME